LATAGEIEAGFEGDTQVINNRTISETEAKIEGDTQTIDNQQLVDNQPSVSKPEP